jgi:hypothetical protein
MEEHTPEREASEMTRWQHTGIGEYYISDFGNVRGPNWRIVKIRIANKRETVDLGRDNSCVSVHRLVALAFVENPDPENLFFVKHIDGNFRNNHYTNLKWARRVEHKGVCIECNTPKPEESFPRLRRKRKLKNGEKKTYIKISNRCRKCSTKRQTARRKKRLFTKILIDHEISRKLKILNGADQTRGSI